MNLQVKLETNSCNSTEESTNLIKSFVFPESLENSKVIGFLNENFSFTIEELYNQKEFKKVFESKDLFIKTIEKIDFVKIDQNQKNCTILISDEMKIYSLINVPAKMIKEDLIKELNLQGKNYFSRVYKKYFVWLLIAENNLAENEKFEEVLKKINFGEEKLKYDITSGINLKKLILKRINYNKESSDLKATAKVDSQSNAINTEAGSWRKKSNDGEENFAAKTFTKTDNVNANTNNFKRKRFNSDAGANDNHNDNIFNYNLEKIIPSDKIKFRYSFKEMLDFFNNSKVIYEIHPQFSNLIDEICIEQSRKNIPLFEELVKENKRDRSKTMNLYGNEFEAMNQKAMNLPKNNPLQDFSNSDLNYNNKNISKNVYNSNSYKNKFDFAN